MMNVEEMGRCLLRLRTVLPQWAPKEVDRDLIAVWLNVLKDYSDGEIRGAFLQAAETLTQWPAPATIKRLCQGSFKTDEEIGQEIASRIEGAMGSVGSGQYNSRQEDVDAHSQRLLAKIGPIGMEVVRMAGGWNHICDSMSDDLPSLRKQWRELATIVSKNFHVTGVNLPPALPEKKNPILQSALKLAIGGA